MKTKRHFIYTKIKETFSRTYGGANYTLALFENKGRGNIVKIGEVSACTRAHKGEKSEAWTGIFYKLPKRQQSALMKHPAVVDTNKSECGGHFPQYFSWSLGEKLGIKLEEL